MWVSVGVGVGDVEGLSDVTIVAIGTTLCVGDGLSVGVVAAALPHPTANTATSASAAIFKVVTVSELSVTLFGQARAKGHRVKACNPLSIRRANARYMPCLVRGNACTVSSAHPARDELPKAGLMTRALCCRSGGLPFV